MNEAATKAKKTKRQFKVVGWFEEVMQQIGDGWKCVGKRVLKAPPDGPLGVATERECTITAPLQLHKGCGEPVTINASPTRPVKIKTRCYPICGPLEN